MPPPPAAAKLFLSVFKHIRRPEYFARGSGL